MSGNNDQLAKGCILVVFLGLACGLVGTGLALVGLGGVSQTATPPVVGGAPSPEPVAATPGQVPEPAAEPVNGPPSGAAVARIRARGVLLVGMDTGEPPYTGTPPMYVPGSTGDPDGFDVVLARRIAAELGVSDIKVVHTKYSGLEELLLDPTAKVDLVISGYSPTDTAGIAWSQPYLEYGLCLVVPKNSKVKTTADLFGKPIGIFDDDAAAEEVEQLVKGYTELVRLEDGYWDQLASNKFAAFLYDYPYAAAELEAWYTQNPSRRDSLRIAQYNLTDSTYAVGARDVERDVVAFVDRAISEWRSSDDYGAAVKTWLKGGKAVQAPVDPQRRTVKVEKGDTLSILAKRELGDVAKWPELWELNRDRFPNPHLIEVGDEVVLP